MNQTPKEVLDTILGPLGFVVEIEEELRDGHLILQIRTNEPQRLIGRRDETLESLQFLVNRLLISRTTRLHASWWMWSTTARCVMRHSFSESINWLKQ